MPEKLELLFKILEADSSSFPEGLPFNGAITREENQGMNDKLERETGTEAEEPGTIWEQAIEITEEFGTAIPPLESMVVGPASSPASHVVPRSTKLRQKAREDDNTHRGC